MTKKIHPALKAKLAAKKTNFEKVTEFAEILPMFSKEIIDGEVTGEEYHRLEYRYGALPLNWGINWYTNLPINYPYEKKVVNGFVNVYINTYSLFGYASQDFASDELSKIIPSIKVHFYDSLNSTFYFLPEEAEDGLKKLEAWYINTKNQCDSYLKKKRKEQLEKELLELS